MTSGQLPYTVEQDACCINWHATRDREGCRWEQRGHGRSTIFNRTLDRTVRARIAVSHFLLAVPGHVQHARVPGSRERASSEPTPTPPCRFDAGEPYAPTQRLSSGDVSHQARRDRHSLTGRASQSHP